MWVVKLYGAVQGSVHSFSREELAKRVRVERVPIPTPRSGQVLIKVAKSGILPMNLSELKATYGTWNKDAAPDGLVLGSEGSGTVISSGGGLLAWRLVGKRVAFFRYNAAWAEYACVPATQVYEIPAEMPFYKAVAGFANPFTCLAFLEIAEAAGCKTIIHTAGASALGLMLIKHGKRLGVNVIAVVRGERHFDTLKNAGALAVLNYEAADFHATLTALAKKHNATVAFDAVAGELTGTVLSAMPSGTIHVYGGLSEQRPVIGTRDLIFKGKQVHGFWLKTYAESKWTLGLYAWTMVVASQLDGDFATAVGASFKLSDVIDAILAYPKTQGRVVLICDPTLKESD
jgi:NADPH:quinone reductase